MVIRERNVRAQDIIEDDDDSVDDDNDDEFSDDDDDLEVELDPDDADDPEALNAR